MLCALIMLATISDKSMAQNCPANVPAIITSNPNTYYPGTDSILNADATSIMLGASGTGSAPIAPGDMLLLIQMQGAQINSFNTTSYGDGITGGSASGYLSNSAMTAGNMEYVVASNSVPLTGGTLSLMTGTINSYMNTGFGINGQYRYQVIRVGLYYNLTLGSTITTPSWNGTSGGVIVLSVTNNLDFNGQTITAAGAGFRGGGARQAGGEAGGLSTDFVTMSTQNFNGSKGEGIAGTPRFINNNGILLDNGSVNEGYPGGSYAAGAPGNAGGGGTDGRPSANDQNSGGGGGANGGTGGKGGNSWSSNLATGGDPGAVFQENMPSRLVMGGGGGAGTTNNGTGALSGFSSSGAAGGGIVLVTAGSVSGSGTIDISGADANATVVNDGSGGGGAGGSTLIYAGSGLSGVTVLANGGAGGSNSGGGSPPPHGPGGGGGGGVIYSNAPVNGSSSVIAGSSGFTTGAIHYGATAGSNGALVQNVTIQQVPVQTLNCSVLPLRFKSAEAKWQDKNVVINWKVTNEAAVNNYTVEKSIDGKKYSTVGMVRFKYTSASDNSYSFTDTKNYNTDITYYRIKEVSESGAFVYSSIVTVKALEETGSPVTVSPNPAVNATASIRFNLKNAPTALIQLRMISINGSTVWQKQYKGNAGMNTVSIANLAAVPNGMYFIQYYNGTDAVNVKLIVSH